MTQVNAITETSFRADRLIHYGGIIWNVEVLLDELEMDGYGHRSDIDIPAPDVLHYLDLSLAMLPSQIVNGDRLPRSMLLGQMGL